MADSVFKEPGMFRGILGAVTGSPPAGVASTLNGTPERVMTTHPSEGVIPNKLISPIALAFDPASPRSAAEAALWSAIEENEEFHQRLMKKVAQRQDFLTAASRTSRLV